MDRPYADKHAAVARAQWRPGSTAAELGALACLAVLCALLVGAISGRAAATRPIAAGQIAAGPAFYAGLNGVEQHADGYPYRWTTGSALVQLRGAYYAAPAYLLELRLRAGNPAGPQPLTVLSGGRPVATVVPEARFRTYRLILADAGVEGGELWLGLQTPTFQPPGDQRALGVMLTDVTLSPLPGPGLAGGAAVALGLVALWAALRALGLG
ncbi:MAG: hypothetical protein HGA45_10090, partial [Chloroflexales bacterium]|nr:hypothetical protein [Chloroflexales bacterium]